MKQESSVVFIKIIENKKSPTYYLSLTTHGETVNVDGKGVIILFTDGTKWTAPNETIDVEAETSNFEYSAFASLTNADMITFQNKKIKKFRLYIYDKEVDVDLSDKLMVYAKCLSSLK